MQTSLLTGLFFLGASVASAQLLEDPVGHQRAGHPTLVKRWSMPSKTPRDIGYNVGGGALSRRQGDPATVDEGTWGYDYRGLVIPRRVNLLWWHGRRYQGGSGAYGTDGPHLPHAEESR